MRVDANVLFQNLMCAKAGCVGTVKIHSIEQPVKAGIGKLMAALCEKSPLPIALDEELIGIHEPNVKEELLRAVKPQYIILKPSLVGGFTKSEEWIESAEKQGVAWWITSALEGNIGLNAIAQWSYTFNNPLPQGLGTGQLFNNNISSPLIIKSGHLAYDTNVGWEDPFDH